MRILLVEDDDTIGSAVRDHIAAGPHAVDWVKNLADAEEVTNAVQYGLILLDLQLPDGSGVDFLKRLRRRPDETPVMILTARDQISDRIEGLNSGADDYLVKPFNLGELTARILAVARRYTGSPQPTIRFADLEIDQPQRRVRLDGRDIVLTGREWAVLDLLVARPGAIVSKDKIEEALYAFGSEIESNTVEVYVSRLRKKIGRDRIRTARGVGYCLGDR
ncbi:MULTISPECIES: response regulator [Rhizobium]|uniref:Two-component system, OmpR family, response regulator n=1 Tax=Rhizobium lusitanum TaxID=293958 RepID=A0A1C3UY77_9HYPH|nr:response regulator transcription factor [Rhizobium lusitanum]NKJ03179.1 two-component system OmpR family response regulator [Rhizobium sp. SG741]NKJ33371.1 two-component system OmpR family response regulator [Rhizobium sp. SG570]NRP86908.1 Transcriptional regulatory protein QseB [Ensifer adhaerens]NTJ08409.1 response regulator transcription factor [Rhizobium lusitanum]SCB20453.1 two-component system, OmpR family, response regulator [Rhizobium lusitanum]